MLNLIHADCSGYGISAVKIYLTLNCLCTMMEDFINREVSRTRAAIEAILEKVSSLAGGKASSAEVHDYVKTEMNRRLDIDIDAIISKDGFASILVSSYGFDNDDLNRFAELLYAMLKNDEGKDDMHNSYARAIVAINKWLEGKGVSFSTTRHYVLEEMNRYF